MTIRYKSGDLMNAIEPIIAHGCNAQGVMGAGVALAIKTRYPKAYEKYMEQFHRNGLELGSIISVETEGKYIINCITQQFYGRNKHRYVSYDAIDECFEKIKYFMKMSNLTSIAIPMIGSSLGGGNWDTIVEIINFQLKDFSVVVYILE